MCLSLFASLVLAQDAEPTPAGEADEREEAAGEADAEKIDGEAAEEAAEPEGPTTVKVGVHINDIMTIDLRTHSFLADGYIWFKWKGDRDPATSMEFINPYELWGHMEEMNFEEPEELEDGSKYQVLRFQGGFSQKLPLYDYPFDKQVLTIVFEDGVESVNGVNYESDGVTMNPALVLPGFNIEPPRLVVGPHQYETTFGDPREKQAETYSRASIEIPIARPVLAYAVKLQLPVLCAAVSAVLMFLFSPARVDSRVSIGITSLLTIVALQITLNEDLPEVGYLTLMDKLYVAAYLVVISGLLAVAYSTRLVETGREQAAIKFDKQTMCALSLGFAVAVAWLLSDAAF